MKTIRRGRDLPSAAKSRKLSSNARSRLFTWPAPGLSKVGGVHPK